MARAVLALLVVLVLVLLCARRSSGEMFTALSHMEGLLDLEKELLTGLNSYLAAERERLSELDRFASRVQQAADAAGSDLHQHLFDPVNAFQLTNRYVNGWMKLHDTVYKDNSREMMANISLAQHRFPSVEDYTGAMIAIRRLQDTYKLDPSLIASGKLGRANSAVPLNARDCYNIGREAYETKNYAHTRSWMMETLRRFDEEEGRGEDSRISLAEVYDHLAFAEYELGNVKRATGYTRDLLQQDPTHKRALDNLLFFQGIQSNKPDEYRDMDDGKDPGVSSDSEHDRYEALCREPNPTPSEDYKDLVCYYFNNKRNPRLILRPAKLEVVFLKPKIYVFRGIINDEEMDRLKVLAGPKLDRATVHDSEGQLVHATYRISKSGWLSVSDDPLGYVKTIDQRIEDTTGLTMETAEQLQVVNYGIGGHYEPHYDHARRGEDAFSNLGSGNRIATLLIYMTDVELGGATVFPLVGARIAPTKGDAAFWWNLKKSGDGDWLTRHAGCPVLVGSKWVCNKWIHERGQEFRRPCGLSEDE